MAHAAVWASRLQTADYYYYYYYYYSYYYYYYMYYYYYYYYYYCTLLYLTTAHFPTPDTVEVLRHGEQPNGHLDNGRSQAHRRRAGG